MYFEKQTCWLLLGNFRKRSKFDWSEQYQEK
jgi:hypothetical protein